MSFEGPQETTIKYGDFGIAYIVSKICLKSLLKYFYFESFEILLLKYLYFNSHFFISQFQLQQQATYFMIESQQFKMFSA